MLLIRSKTLLICKISYKKMIRYVLSQNIITSYKKIQIKFFNQKEGGDKILTLLTLSVPGQRLLCMAREGGTLYHPKYFSSWKSYRAGFLVCCSSILYLLQSYPRKECSKSVENYCLQPKKCFTGLFWAGLIFAEILFLQS